MRLSPSDVYILSQETGPGFVIIDNFLERSKKLTAASVADAASKYEGFRPAGMGRGLGRWAAEDKRGDKIAWLKRDGTREDSETHQISSNASPKSQPGGGGGGGKNGGNRDTKGGGKDKG